MLTILSQDKGTLITTSREVVLQITTYKKKWAIFTSNESLELTPLGVYETEEEAIVALENIFNELKKGINFISF